MLGWSAEQSSTTAEAETAETTVKESPADPWTDFWTEFQTAVAADDAEKVASLSIDPLPIGEPAAQTSNADLVAKYDTYFDADVKAAVKVPAAGVKELVMIEEYSERYNTPVGEAVRQVPVRVDNVSRTFVFGPEADGSYKLRSIILLDHS